MEGASRGDLKGNSDLKNTFEKRRVSGTREVLHPSIISGGSLATVSGLGTYEYERYTEPPDDGEEGDEGEEEVSIFSSTMPVVGRHGWATQQQQPYYQQQQQPEGGMEGEARAPKWHFGFIPPAKDAAAQEASMARQAKARASSLARLRAQAARGVSPARQLGAYSSAVNSRSLLFESIEGLASAFRDHDELNYDEASLLEKKKKKKKSRTSVVMSMRVRTTRTRTCLSSSE